MPTPPRHEDMRLDPSLNIMPEGLLVDLLAAVYIREAPQRIQRTREASREEALCQLDIFLPQ